MDVKSYFKRIRELESQLTEGDHVVVSLKTADGGREGVKSEVPREIACRMVVEKRARLANEDEREQYHGEQAEARASFEQTQAERQLQVQLIRALEHAPQSKKPGKR